MAPAQIFKEILSCLKNEDFATVKENRLARFVRQRKKDLINLWLKSLLNRTIIYYSNIYTQRCAFTKFTIINERKRRTKKSGKSNVNKL